MQGIEEPIRGGDVRDNVDKYKVIMPLCLHWDSWTNLVVFVGIGDKHEGSFWNVQEEQELQFQQS